MSCRELEPEIALYAGGDLPAERLDTVERHLAGCAECRALVEELESGRALLLDLRDDPIEEMLAAEVRRSVLARIDAPRPVMAWLWKPALALAAAAVLLVLALWWPKHRASDVPAVSAAARGVPVEPVWTPPAVRAAVARVKRRARVRPVKTRPPLLVQMVTGDPNIVIYWLVEQKPQGD